MKATFSPLARRLQRLGWLAALLAGSPFGVALAQVTDLADAPLFTTGASTIKPNIMFIMDDSLSMSYEYLPSEASGFGSDTYGFHSSHCNGVAYNPKLKYDLPVYFTSDSDEPKTKPPGDISVLDGTPASQVNTQRNLNDPVEGMPEVGETLVVKPKKNSTYDSLSYSKDNIVTVFDPSRTDRFFVGTVTSWNSTKTELTIKVTRVVGSGVITSPKIGFGEPKPARYFKYTGKQADLAFQYDAKGALLKSGDFWSECNSKIGSNPGSKVFEEVTLGVNSSEAQNYANWHAYYSNRLKMMTSAISRAFAGLDNRYRLGYTTINSKTAKEASKTSSDYYKFLDIQDLTTAHKAKFYDFIDNVQLSTYTPLRGALAKVGQYYANKANGQTHDPVQYSCQRNFAILSTDGYWNIDSESTSPKFGPYQLDNSTKVGQQDGSPMTNADRLPPKRPMLDGGSSTKVWEETWDIIDENRFEEITPVTVTSVKVEGGTETTTVTTKEQTRYSYSSCNITGTKCTETGIVEQATKTDKVTVTTVTTSTQPGTLTAVVSERTITKMKRTVTEINGVEVNSTEDVVSTTNDKVTISSNLDLGEPKTSQTKTETQTVTGTYSAWKQIRNFTNKNVARNRYPSVVASDPVSTTSNKNVPEGDPKVTTTATGTVSRTPLDPVEQTITPKSAPKVLQTTSTSGVSNTLADVAAYYYETDLRTDALGNCTGGTLPNGGTQNVCKNNVPVTTGTAGESYGDSANWQHMTTLTLGLGVNGTLKYDPNYKKQKSGDFYDILTGAKNWPAPVEVKGTTEAPTNIDDLWHAAVNGRGTYYSASDPTTLTKGLTQALDEIKAVTGAASAASTSSLQPVEGDNDIYVAQFTSVKWIGDVRSFKIDVKTGDISKTPSWSAKEKLDAKDPATRAIYYRKPGAKTLREFTLSNLTEDSYDELFTNFCEKKGANGGLTPMQCSSALTDAEKAAANVAENLVAYLRGDQTKEYYRYRESRLGDVINASPLFIGRPPFQYTENGYQTFASEKANRTAVVLAAANDGMLHAFSRDTGEELWAYIPSFVMDKLYLLADEGFGNHHHYMVDGSPQMGDIYDGTSWKTIVVGGLNKGGRGYYALDVTNPASPKLLWEFSHDDLGLSFGNPVITKMKDGTWIVAVSSGYNNVSPGDGNGHLFILDANTGELLQKISTNAAANKPAGTELAPSGLAKINVWVDSELENLGLRFYGGDLKGNLWRFDHDERYEPKGKALLLAQLVNDDDKAQAITTRPTLAEVKYNGGKYPVVYVATGRYLGVSDLTDKTVHSVYGIKDSLTEDGWGKVRDKLVEQTITSGNEDTTRSSSNEKVDWSSKAGWYADLPGSGERVSVNPALALDTLYVGANIPSADACEVGGRSFLYQFNILTGSSTAEYLSSVLVQGIHLGQSGGTADAGTVVAYITRSDGSIERRQGAPLGVFGTLRRTSWRELLD